jgi:hypothetical protein
MPSGMGEMVPPRPRMDPASTVTRRRDLFLAFVVWITGDNYRNIVTKAEKRRRHKS